MLASCPHTVNVKKVAKKQETARRWFMGARISRRNWGGLTQTDNDEENQ